MALKLAAGVLAALAIAASPALACTGPTVIYADNFQSIDPAWAVSGQGTSQPQGSFTISGGVALLAPPVGDYTYADYGGMFVDSGDACVSVISPTVSDPTQAAAGIMFGMTDPYNFYVFAVEQDGQAIVLQSQGGGWVNPTAWRPASTVKKGGNATNNLRVTWNGTTGAGTAYINDQQFTTFTIKPLKNTKFGLWSEGDPGVNPTVGATAKFSNLKITNVP